MNDRLSIPSVTGADLEFRVAGTGGRSYAFIIDWHIRLVVALAWYLLATLLYGGMTSWFDAGPGLFSAYFYVSGLPALFIYLFYHLVLEILMDGRTPGKRIAGIRIVTHDGGSPALLAHFVRNAFRLVDSLPFAYVVGIATTLLTRNNVRLGDLAAGSLLVYDPVDERKVLAGMQTLYRTGIGINEAELLRDLVERWEHLDPAVRPELGRRLLARLDPGQLPPSSDPVILARLQQQLRVA